MKTNPKNHQVPAKPELHFPNSRTCLLSLGASRTYPAIPLILLDFKFGEMARLAAVKKQVRGKFGRCVSTLFHSPASYGAPLLPPKGGVRRHLRRTLPLGGRCLRLTLSGTNQQSGGLHG